MTDFKLPTTNSKRPEKPAPKDSFRETVKKTPLERQVELLRELLSQPAPPPKK